MHSLHFSKAYKAKLHILYTICSSVCGTPHHHTRVGLFQTTVTKAHSQSCAV